MSVSLRGTIGSSGSVKRVNSAFMVVIFNLNIALPIHYVGGKGTLYGNGGGRYLRTPY